MFGLQLKSILLVAAGAGATALVIGGWLHYKDILDDRAELQMEVQALRDADAVQKDTIRQAEARVHQWQQKYSQAQEIIIRYAEVQQQSREEVNRLRRLFAENDLEDLAREQPEVLERAINSGSSRINRLLECASGGGDNCTNQSTSPSDRDTTPEAGEVGAGGR